MINNDMGEPLPHRSMMYGNRRASTSTSWIDRDNTYELRLMGNRNRLDVSHLTRFAVRRQCSCIYLDIA